jgi:hypothetical protein
MTVGIWVCALAASPAGFEVRQSLDDFRGQHGLCPVRQVESLTRAAKAHCDYMLANNAFGHSQDPRHKSFTGRTSGDRARAFGYVGANCEALSWSSLGDADAFAGLIAAPYHRAMFLQPARPDFGAAALDGTVCVKLGGETGDGAVVSPSDGSTSVPARWDGSETPDPLRGANLKGDVGYPVVLALYGKDAKGFRFVSAALTDKKSANVPMVVLHEGNDRHSKGMVVLIARAPFAKGAAYRATVTYKNASGEHTVTSRFETAR